MKESSERATSTARLTSAAVVVLLVILAATLGALGARRDRAAAIGARVSSVVKAEAAAKSRELPPARR